METKHGDKKKIYRWLKLKQSTFSGIISGHAGVGKARARDLEKISGIDLKDWLFLDYKKLADKIYKAWRKHNDKSTQFLK